MVTFTVMGMVTVMVAVLWVRVRLLVRVKFVSMNFAVY